MTTVAVLGTGLMGSGMARSLLRADMDVRVWNRTIDKARPLEDDGATVCTDPAAAVTGTDVVITMLFDGPAVEAVMADTLAAIPDDAVWLQTSTIGLDAAQACATLAETRGIGFVDSPVLGTREPAEQGKLVALAAGEHRLRDQVAPALDAVAARTLWVSEQPGDGHRLKLVANAWVLSITGATAQSVALARALDLDPQLFLDAIAGGPSDCTYAQMKAASMMSGEFPPSFTLGGAVKDTGLIADTMRTNDVTAALMVSLNETFAAAADAGHADEDMAAVVTAFGPRSTD